MSRAIAAVLLGVALDLCAAAFDSPSLYLPGVALVLLGAAAAVWVAYAAQDAGVERVLGPATVEEERAYPVLIDVRLPFGSLAGELVEPLLESPCRSEAFAAAASGSTFTSAAAAGGSSRPRAS